MTINNLFKKIFIVLSILLILFVVFFASVTHIIKNTDAYRYAIDYIQTDPNFMERLGKIDRIGYFVSGSVEENENGGGIADFRFHVKGTNRENILVDIDLKRVDYEWKIINVSYD